MTAAQQALDDLREAERLAYTVWQGMPADAPIRDTLRAFVAWQDAFSRYDGARQMMRAIIAEEVRP